MKRMLFNATYQEELRVATVDDKKLLNFDIETSSKTQRRGNIYKGVITRVEPSLEACFVDYGTEKQGFLPFKEIDPKYLPENSKYRDFNSLKEGAELIIQVEKDERGNKGAALTTYVSLPGRYLVLMPNNSRAGGISRRIDGDERDELKRALGSLEVPQGMSIIARTAALGRQHEELEWDLVYLLKLWDAINTASINNNGSFLIYQESNLVVRSIRDHFSPDITEILIDMEDIFDQAKQFMSHVMPAYVDRVKFYNDDIPLFSRFQIEHQIDTAYNRVVHLPSGGSIVIDHTEALTSIDVNSAKANKGSDIEATAFATNIEAAEEIARQLRMRDLGGLVVVDFIDMESQKNQRDVENSFKLQLGLDRARIQMSKLSKFGLLELSRQRLQSSLEESTSIPCPKCAGIGTIRGTESAAIHILRMIQDEVVKNAASISQLHVQLPVSIATYLLNEKRNDLAKIESRLNIRVLLIPNIHFEVPNYKFRKIAVDGYDPLANKSSYTLVEAVEENLSITNRETRVENSMDNKPMVRNITLSSPAPIMGNKRIFNKVFGFFANILKPADKTKSVEVSHSLHAKPLNTNNKFVNNKTSKVKPGNSNRNVNKPQAPRQNQQRSPQSQRYDNISKSDTLGNNKNPNRNNLRVNNRSSLASAPMNDSNLKVTPPKNEEVVANNTSVNQNYNKLAINQAWGENQNPTPAAKASENEVSTPIAANEGNQKQFVATAEVVTIVKQNTIMQPVDLGEFELVVTDLQLKNNYQPIVNIDATLTRYNDVVTTTTTTKIQELEYELVETKVN
jgi:ribonuclease E